MCLVINLNPIDGEKDAYYGPGLTPLVSENDIECYKILVNHNGKLKTPFMYADVDLDKVFKSDKFEEKITEKNTLTGSLGFVNNGIHSFMYLNQALCLFHKMRQEHMDDIPEIYRCEIPKGTRYYIGVDWEYCSEYVRFIEKVEING